MSFFASIALAGRTRGDSLSESFRNHTGLGRDDTLLALLIAVAVVAGLWAASRLLGLRRRRRGYHNPWQLFRDLCKAHQLNWSDRWLLRRVARHQNLRDPGRLFLESERWEEQALGPAFALEFARLRALREQIFAGATSGDRGSGFSHGRGAKPHERGTTTPVAAPASPLFPGLPTPTLDVPPWTATQSVEP
jgi:hypothetical protein